jgi:hypothetical protein
MKSILGLDQGNELLPVSLQPARENKLKQRDMNPARPNPVAQVIPSTSTGLGPRCRCS